MELWLIYVIFYMIVTTELPFIFQIFLSDNYYRIVLLL